MRRAILALALASAAAALASACHSPGGVGADPAVPPGSVAPPAVAPSGPTRWEPTTADLAQVAALDGRDPLEVARGLAGLASLPDSRETAAAALDERFNIHCESVCHIERKD